MRSATLSQGTTRSVTEQRGVSLKRAHRRNGKLSANGGVVWNGDEDGKAKKWMSLISVGADLSTIWGAGRGEDVDKSGQVRWRGMTDLQK